MVEPVGLIRVSTGSCVSGQAMGWILSQAHRQTGSKWFQEHSSDGQFGGYWRPVRIDGLV